MISRVAVAVLLLSLLLVVPSNGEDAAEKGTVVIYRQSRVVARIYRAPIRIGDQLLLNLPNGSVWSAELPAGTYRFSAHDKDVFSAKDKNASAVEVTVRPGETVYIKASLVMGGRKPNTALTIVETEEGSPATKSLKPVKPGDVKHPDFQ